MLLTLSSLRSLSASTPAAVVNRITQAVDVCLRTCPICSFTTLLRMHRKRTIWMLDGRVQTSLELW